MPEILTLENIGLKGLATDPQPWSLPPEFITFGINYRIFAGAMIAKSGFNLWTTAPVNFNPGHLIHAGSTSGDYWVVAGRDAIYAWDGVTWFDISSVTGYAPLNANDELLWTSCLLGQFPILNNPQTTPEYWAPPSPGNPMLPLPFEPGVTWDDLGFTATIFRSHKTFLFALGLREGGIDYLDSYRWSHPADANDIPVTWDETNDAFLAGRASLGSDTGAIIDGRSLRDAFAIYSEQGINILDFTNDEFVWRRRELSSTVGLLAKNSLVEVKGSHFFIGDGDILKNDGNSITSIAHNRMRRELIARIDVSNYDRSFSVRNDALKEIWFCIPEIGESYPTIAYIYNWKDDSWAVKELPDNIAHANYGSQTEGDETWDGTPDLETWDTQNRRWGAATLSPLDDTVVGANPVTGTLYLLDPSGAPDEDFGSRVERTDFPLLDVREVTTITRVYPHIQGEGDLSIQFGSQDYPGAPVRWKPAVIFNPSQDRKIDIRTTGELHAWRFQSLGKTTWQLSGFTIEFERSGKR